MRPEIKVGLTVLAGLALIYLALAWVNRAHVFSPPEQDYQIEFDNVNGLLDGDPVTVRGYASGRVLRINPQADRVVVQISLSKRIFVATDARATIQLKELMGGKQIELFPGTGSQPLPSNQAIPGSIAPDFSSAFSIVDTFTRQFSPGQVEQLSRDLQALVHNLSMLTATLNQADLDQILTDLSVALRSTRQLMARLEASGLVEDGAQMVRRADTTLANVNLLAGEVRGQTLPMADSTLSELKELLVESRQTLQKLDKTVIALNDSSGLVQRFLTDPDLYTKFDSTLYNLNEALKTVHSEKVIIGLKRKNKD